MFREKSTNKLFEGKMFSHHRIFSLLLVALFVGSTNAGSYSSGAISTRSLVYNAGLMPTPRSSARSSRRSTRRSGGGVFGIQDTTPNYSHHAGIVDKEMDAPHLNEVQHCSVRKLIIEKSN